MLNETERAFLVTSLPFFQKLSPSEKKVLLQHAGSTAYRKGESIHSADYKCLGLLLVKSGSLRVYMMSEDGREITLYRFYTC